MVAQGPGKAVAESGSDDSCLPAPFLGFKVEGTEGGVQSDCLHGTMHA
jgi:hypothetical protein